MAVGGYFGPWVLFLRITSRRASTRLHVFPALSRPGCEPSTVGCSEVFRGRGFTPGAGPEDAGAAVACSTLSSDQSLLAVGGKPMAALMEGTRWRLGVN